MADMTDAEDLLLEIANSMEKPFFDPIEHANWCVEEARKYFVERGKRLSHTAGERQP